MRSQPVREASNDKEPLLICSVWSISAPLCLHITSSLWNYWVGGARRSLSLRDARCRARWRPPLNETRRGVELFPCCKQGGIMPSCRHCGARRWRLISSSSPEFPRIPSAVVFALVITKMVAFWLKEIGMTHGGPLREIVDVQLELQFLATGNKLS